MDKIFSELVKQIHLLPQLARYMW